MQDIELIYVVEHFAGYGTPAGFVTYEGAKRYIKTLGGNSEDFRIIVASINKNTPNTEEI